MLDFLNSIEFGRIIISFTFVYLNFKLLTSSDEKNYSSIILATIMMLITLNISDLIKIEILRLIFNCLILMVIMSILNKYKLNNRYKYVRIIVTSIFSILLLALAEIIYTLLILFITTAELKEVATMYSSHIISDIGISLISIILVNIRVLVNKIITVIDDINLGLSKSVIALVILLIIIFSTLFYQIYIVISPVVLTILNLSIILIVTGLILLNFKEKSKVEKMESEYGIVLKNMRDYEEMLEKQRMSNHENKNQLAVIKGMLTNKYNSKKINEYINSIIKDKLVDDEDILFKTKFLPVGGLQGLFYQKFLAMKDRNIKYQLNIGKKINFEKLIDLDLELNKQICTVLGIYLDNSIEAAEKTDEKEIIVQFYTEEGFINISISNSYFGLLELDKIDNKGYSSKGLGRGYGLNLVKQILENNSKLINTREINGNVFKQILKIKV